MTFQVTVRNFESSFPFDISEDNDSFTLADQNVLRVQTKELTFLGENQLLIQAVLPTEVQPAEPPLEL